MPTSGFFGNGFGQHEVMNMKTMRLMMLGLAVSMMIGPLGTGCSCKSGQRSADLDLLATPSTLVFGTVELGSSLPLSVELKHIGTEGTVDISSMVLDDLTNEFVVKLPEKMTLAVGESVWVTVTYTPTGASASDGALLINHNVASRGNVTRIPITANGRVGDLLVDPNPIDFEQVESGKDYMLDVMVQNYGSAPITISSMNLRLDGSTDFTIEAYPEGKTFPFELAPTEKVFLVMKYAPTNGGNDESKLVVEGDSEGQRRSWSFDVIGEEMGPLLEAMPGELHFGAVKLHEEKVLLLEIKNNGNADLIIGAGGFTLWPPNTVYNIVVKNQPTEELRIAPDSEPVQFQIAWTPGEATPDDGNPLCSLMIASNDPMKQTLIPVFGTVDAPKLIVIPDSIDMGFGALMTPVERQVTLQNAGSGTLHITKLEVVDASDTQYGVEFAISSIACTTDSGDACTIAGNTSTPVKVIFTNRGPATGEVTAKLRITSNYADNEIMDVPIIVRRSGAPVCTVALSPPGISFGTVAIGWPAEKFMSLVNVGTGPCTFIAAKLTDCSAGFMGGTTCNTPMVGGQSQIFQLRGVPATNTELAAGSTTTMTVRFNPPPASPLFGLLNQYFGLLGVQVKAPGSAVTTTLPKANGTTYLSNVQGASGLAKISVLPGELKFGVTTIGCFSKTYKVCIYNSGNAPLMVNDISLKGCSPEFKVKNIPKLPMAVPNGAPKCIEAVYAPQDEGPDTCSMQIAATDSSSPNVLVKLSGSGTYETHQTDEFTQVTGQEVDILWIIDDSGSMCEEQDRLNQSFSDFIANANVWKNDYHMGSISVNVVDDKVMGRLNRGKTSITPRYMTKTNGGSFAQLTDYGCDGGSDAQESGLQAAQTALSAPLATDTGISCSSPADCTSDPNICPDPAKCAYSCVEGKCGGFNAGFLRENAQLELVVLSDEEDQSPGGLPFYIDFLKNIKGWYNVEMMHFNAIVGIYGVPNTPSGGSSSETGDCVSSDGGTAWNGDRYLQVASDTKGQAGSICESSYSNIMQKIGDVTFRPKIQFFLTRLADPSTVTVKVNGTLCSSGYRYDAPSNSVIFDTAGSCMPGPGDKILIDYETLCLTS
jgi:hypothetical protein